MKVIANNIEVRAVEVKVSKKTGNEYIALRLEDSSGAWLNVIDRNMDNKAFYTKGAMADFELNIVIAKEYASVSVVSVSIKK